MTERERLINFLIGCYPISKLDKQSIKKIADYLFANGITAPSVKIGDIVYVNFSPLDWHLKDKDRPYKAKVLDIEITENTKLIRVVYEKGYEMLCFPITTIGNSLFLTREEAEMALEKEKI